MNAREALGFRPIRELSPLFVSRRDGILPFFPFPFCRPSPPTLACSLKERGRGEKGIQISHIFFKSSETYCGRNFQARLTGNARYEALRPQKFYYLYNVIAISVLFGHNKPSKSRDERKPIWRSWKMEDLKGFFNFSKAFLGA